MLKLFIHFMAVFGWKKQNSLIQTSLNNKGIYYFTEVESRLRHSGPFLLSLCSARDFMFRVSPVMVVSCHQQFQRSHPTLPLPRVQEALPATSSKIKGDLSQKSPADIPHWLGSVSCPFLNQSLAREGLLQLV